MTETTPFDRLSQARWEMEGVRRAKARYEAAAAVSDPATLPSGQKLLREVVPVLTRRIEQAQREAVKSIASRTGTVARWAWTIQTLDAQRLALITITCALRGTSYRDGRGDDIIANTAELLSVAVREEVQYQGWLAQQVAERKAALEAGDPRPRDVLAALRAHHPTVHRNVWSRWRRKLGLTLTQPWSHADGVALGAALLAFLVEVSGGRFELALERTGTKTRYSLRLSPETRAMMEDIEQRAAVARPMLMPMRVPPNDWRYCTSQTARPERPAPARFEGGYQVVSKPLMSAGLHRHSSALEQPQSAMDLEAINILQATPWRINRWILDQMLTCWAEGLRLGGLEIGEPHSVPDRMEDAVWAAMTPDAQRTHRQMRGKIYAENASIHGRSQAVMDALTVAEETRDCPSIWFPHTKDFRGRVYPATGSGPHPQGSDIQKSLLMFAEGVPLGPDGLYWLCVRAANTFGMDKLPMEERVAWTLGKTNDIATAATSPLTSVWWTNAVEPWSFLATCVELTMALSSSSVENFVSHLPIPMDGSCNGLQHLSAMGLDPVGAHATNLTPDPVRQDIYQEVANRVVSMVNRDALGGVVPAIVWTNHVSRQTVKRSVMTTPYGVTGRGIRDQLLADGLVPSDETTNRGAAADYMRDCLGEALQSTVAAAKDIMAWLQSCADKLAKAGLPFEWHTPTGGHVCQSYHPISENKIHTLIGDLTLRDELPQGGLNPRKQASGAAPNVIHSFDAAHLTMTVLEAHKAGIAAFAMIHDSYATHAGNTTRLAGILRQTFVDIYSQDWLSKLYQEVCAYAPHVEFDQPPARGEFDVREVLEASYFFS